MNVERLERYFERAVANGERSPKTRDQYLRSVRRFDEWLSDEHSGVGEPDVSHAKDFLEHLWYEKELQSSSVNVYKCAVGKYFSVTDRAREYVDVTEWFSDQFTITTKETHDYFEEGELDQLKEDVSEPRRAAMVYLLAETGMRRAELVSLDVDDIDTDSQRVRISRRKRRDNVSQWRHLSDDATDALGTYMDKLHLYGPTVAVESDALFFSGRASGDGSWRVTDDYVRRLINDAGDECSHPNVDRERIHPHLFRHTVGTRLAMDGRSAKEIASYLGQKRAASAERYMHFAPEQAEEMHRIVVGDGS